MANLHLVTGYAGTAHIKSEDHGAFNAALLGSGQFVFETGNKFSASIVTNNLVRVHDGEIYMQGRHIRLNKDNYVDLNIENGAQGYYRNDLIVARYTKNAGTGIEEVNLVVIKGTAAASSPADPEYTSGDLLNDNALQNDMPLYRVRLDGLTLTEVDPLFETFDFTIPSLLNIVNGKAPKSHQHSAADMTKGILPVARGGTGVASLAALIEALKMPRVATGSFVGTGTYGSNNPITLNFDFTPKLVIVMAQTGAAFSHEDASGGWAFMINGIESFRNTMYQNTYGQTVRVTWGEKSVQWYCATDSAEDDGNNGHAQLNALDRVYHYFAIG